MQQRWWIGVVAIVGIGLAILLFPRPDTGADIPDADPTNLDPTNFKDNPELPPGTAVNPNVKRPKIDPNRIKKGPNPAARELQELRSTPAAVYAAKLTGPWSAVRYTLMKANADDASVLADEINPVLADLRTMRRDPQKVDFSELETRMTAMDAKVTASAWADDETITTSLERYRTLIAEYHAGGAEGEAPTEDGKEN